MRSPAKGDIMNRELVVPMVCAGITGLLGGVLLTWLLVALDLMP